MRTSLRPEGKRQRRLGVAAVNPVRRLAGRKQAVGIAEPAPRRVDCEHPPAHAQRERSRLDRRDIAAMRVHHDELAAPRPRDAVADLRPGADRGLRRQRQRAGVLGMLARDAHRLQRQKQNRQVVRDSRCGALDVAVVDEGVDADREMRTVLLDRRHRQDGDDFAHVGALEIQPGHVGPESRPRHRAHSPRLSRVRFAP